MSVVQVEVPHTSSVKEMINLNKTTIVNVGKRKEPSKEALERFVDYYIEVVKRNEKKQKD